MSATANSAHVVVVGAGVCGLAAAYELCRQGVHVTVLEQDQDVGGLAGSFDVNGARLEKFYHHWFTTDRHVMELIDELGMHERILVRPTRTGMYYANRSFRLSTPLDLLRFDAISLAGRIRLGLLTLRARRVRDWIRLEEITAQEWLRRLCGEEAWRVVWEPLLRGKFCEYADEVSAVWFWNKLKLRGGSRGRAGREELAYYRGGFATLCDDVCERIRAMGGEIRPGSPVVSIEAAGAGGAAAVRCADGSVLRADAVVATVPLPLLADLLAGSAPPEYLAGLRRIRYLANLCLVLELDRSLSETYWLNVNDPGFPFVAIIEHTNFEPASSYHGRHIVYLSKYLPETDPRYRLGDGELLDYTLPFIRRMFPDFDSSWVLASHVWRARHAQPLVECGYSRLIPELRAPLPGVYVASMAQIYPEDRGTNYAVRQGRAAARAVAADLART